MPSGRPPENLLLLCGLGVVIAGLVFVFAHQCLEFVFQCYAVSQLKADYHWRSYGDYISGVGGIVVLVIGAIMMVLATFLAARKATGHRSA
jgi:hypothetical protein